MTSTLGSRPEPQTGSCGRDRLARAWARAVRRTSYVPMNWAELVTYFRDVTDQIVEILVSEPFQAQPGYPLGASLVKAHFTGPRTLGRTLTTLNTRLLPELGSELDDTLTELECRDRIHALLGEFASGYAQALVDRTLDEQERIRSAAITAQAETERQLRASDARFRAVFAGAGTGIGIADVEGHVIEANQALASMLGYTVAELRRHTVAEFTHPSDRAGLARTYADLVAGEVDRFRTEKRYSRKDGSDLWADMSVSLIREDSGDPHYVVIMMHDVTERHRLYQRLRRQALHDPLTQLPNRMMFLDRLQERFDAGEAGGRIGLCYLDLDGFKAVNDSLGHDVGDELLIRLANRLHERLVPVGHLVARMGGDEFVILVDDCQHIDDAIAVAHLILDAVNEPVLINGHQLRATASVGVVERALDETNPADLMKAADITLYQAKISGKNRWAVHDPELDGRQTARHTLAATMPAALASGELSIWYQPIVALADGSPLGAEAVIRWKHPEFGELMPEQFLHLAEETGLIDQIGCWALGEACREAARWARVRPEHPPFLSLDLTAGQAREARVVEDVQAALSAAGLPADQLQLELNGAATAVTEPVLRRNLEALAATGVRLAVDGYGTGTANLHSLRDLPVRGLKLAGTFTAALDPSGTRSRLDTELVGSVIDLGRRLGLEVVAEGVDTQERCEQLQTMGCPTGQGALFRSGTSEDFERSLARDGVGRYLSTVVE